MTLRYKIRNKQDELVGDGRQTLTLSCPEEAASMVACMNALFGKGYSVEEENKTEKEE